MARVPATTDPRIDAYIAKAAAYAQPILIELRARVHSACPEVVETIKWRAPSFEHHGFLGGFAAFKNYCSFMFWQEQPLTAEGPEIQAVIEQCAKITTVQDLPGKVAFRKVIKLAMKRNEAGQQQKRVPKMKPAKLHMPEAFALAKNRLARQHYEGFAAGYQRDYLEWIVDAKRDSTRDRRILQAIEWLRDGKHRNWKYERC